MSDGVIRTVRVRVEIIRWNWSTTEVKKRESKPIDLTADGSVLNYRIQKSIKTPRAEAQLTLLPQRGEKSLLDLISVMDVLRIYEFDVLKFQGYIRRVSYAGSINPQTGAPNRESVLTATGFGGLLHEASVGLGLGRVIGNLDALIASATKLKKNIADVVGSTGASYGAALNALSSHWFTFVEEVGGAAFREYVNTYMDLTSAVDTTSIQVTPRTFDLYNGNEESLTFWQVALQLAETPLNELWMWS